MRIFTVVLMIFFTISLFSQTTLLEGYIYESGNRGYISGVSVTAENIETEKIIAKTKTDKNGFFQVDVPINSKIRIYAAKDMFDIKRVETEVGTGKAFLKLEMGRAPGYTFEVTLSEKKSFPDQVVDALTGTRIEVFNNTTRQSVMDLKNHDNPEFQLNLEKGNHYTILIRKNGFLSKRMEAKVDVEGCILCFEGVGNVGPGVSDNLTGGNAFGVLLANVELERIFEGKTMEIQNLYYDLGKWNLKGAARSELKKVITLMKDNPNLTLELGSHTDSRGTSESNLVLSNKRAQSAVKYLIQKGNISKARIVSKGYGENVLLNDCTNGVKCPEEEHAINRRTELKIIGITDMKALKSLAQMKKEAFLEEEILGLMDQEQIKAKNEEELKQIIENDKTDKSLATDIQRLIESDKKMEEVAEEKEIKVMEEENDIMKNIDETEVLKIGEKDTTETLIIADVKKDLEKNTKQIDIEDEVKNVDIPTPNKETEQSEEIKQETSSDENKSSITTSVSDGVKVVLYQSKTPLPVDHFIFLRHNNVEVMDGGNGKIYYMIGGFENEPAAFKFRKSFILPDKNYKGSFVAWINNGNLAVVNQ